MIRFRHRGLLAACLLIFGSLILLEAAPPEVEAADAKYRAQIRSARRYLMRGDAEKAAEIYLSILKKHPQDEQAATGYSDALIQNEQYDEAEEFLAEALTTIDPKVNLYRKRETLRRKQGKLELAFSDAIQVMAEHDGMTPWVFKETRELIAEGLDAGKAAKEARDIFEANEDNPSFAILNAAVLALDNKWRDAINLMKKVDESKEQNGQLIKRYAEEMNTLGFKTEAIDALEVAAEVSKKPARRTQILFSMADLLKEESRFEEAIQKLELVSTEREGTSAAGKALIQSAAIYQKHLDDPAGALTVYERLREDPSIGHYRPEMLLEMGDCYMRLGRFPEAATTFEQVLPEALDPEHAERAAIKMADVAFFRGDADSALVLYQDMAEAYSRSLMTDEAAGRYILLNTYASLGGGEALEHLGRMEWGRTVKDSSVVEDSANLLIKRYPSGELAAEAWIALAEIAEGNSDFQTALKHLQKVVTDHAEDRRAPLALRRQGDIYLHKLSDSDLAVEKYQRILTEYPDSVIAGEVRREVEKIRLGLKS